MVMTIIINRYSINRYSTGPFGVGSATNDADREAREPVVGDYELAAPSAAGTTRSANVASRSRFRVKLNSAACFPSRSGLRFIQQHIARTRRSR
jgi:hypothetical protein